MHQNFAWSFVLITHISYSMLHVTSTVNTNVLGDHFMYLLSKVSEDWGWYTVSRSHCRGLQNDTCYPAHYRVMNWWRLTSYWRDSRKDLGVWTGCCVLFGLGGEPCLDFNWKKKPIFIDFKNWHCGMTVLFCAKFQIHVTCWVRLKKFFFQFRKKCVYAIPCNGPQLGISIRAGKYLSRIHHQQHVLQWLWDCFILQGT